MNEENLIKVTLVTIILAFIVTAITMPREFRGGALNKYSKCVQLHKRADRATKSLEIRLNLLSKIIEQKYKQQGSLYD